MQYTYLPSHVIMDTSGRMHRMHNNPYTPFISNMSTASKLSAIAQMAEKVLQTWLNDSSRTQIEDLCAKKMTDLTEESMSEHDWIVFNAFLNACKTHDIEDEIQRDAIFESIVDSFLPPLSHIQREYTSTASELRYMRDPESQRDFIYEQAEEFEDDLVRLNFDGDLTEKYVLDIPDTPWALHIDPCFTREVPERYTVKERVEIPRVHADVARMNEAKREAEMTFIKALLDPDMSTPKNAYTFTSEGKRILCETPNFFAIVPGNRDSTPQPLAQTTGPCSLIHVLVFTKLRIWNAVSTEQMMRFDFDEAKDCANEAIRILLERYSDDCPGEPSRRGCAFDRLVEANEKNMWSTTVEQPCDTYDDLLDRAETVEYSFHLYPHNSINTLHMHAWCPKLATKSYDFQMNENLFKYVSVENVLSTQWKQKAGILTDDEKVTTTDLGARPMQFRMTELFYNGERMSLQEFQQNVVIPAMTPEVFDGAVDIPPTTAVKDLSIPHFAEEIRMKLQWFDDAKAHVEKYFDSDENNMYKETYAPIPNFISDTPKVDITWFQQAKQFVKNNWVLVGEDTFAKPGSVYTKQGRFQNSLEWKDPLRQSKPDVHESVMSVAKNLKAMSPTDRQTAVDIINKSFMTAGVTKPMVTAAAWEELGDNVENEPRWEEKKAASGPRLTRAMSECCADTGLPRLTRAMSENVL